MIIEITQEATSQNICDRLIARGEDPAELLGLSRTKLEDTYEEITDEDMIFANGWFC